MASLEKVNYGGWPNCYRLFNQSVELIVTTDVGPRIIRFGFIGEDNEFTEFPDMLGRTGDEDWLVYGGHRLWHAPEVFPRTYYGDNGPVELEEHGDFVRLIQPTEPTTGIQKEMDITLAADSDHVKVVHRLRNNGLWAVEISVWALSVMAPGGTGILPLPPRAPHGNENLAPLNAMALWSYTDFADPRWAWGTRYILLRQDANSTSAQKIGLLDTEGWAAYARNGHLFMKTIPHVKGATYPDMGCSAEVFTNADILEVESLSPLGSLEPSAVVEHEENWFLFKDVQVPQNDADVEKHILPKVEAALSQVD